MSKPTLCSPAASAACTTLGTSIGSSSWRSTEGDIGGGAVDSVLIYIYVRGWVLRYCQVVGKIFPLHFDGNFPLLFWNCVFTWPCRLGVLARPELLSFLGHARKYSK